MKLKKIFLSLIFSFTLASCSNNVNPLVKPTDYTLDYWIGDKINPINLIEENIYRQEADNILYLDSKYEVKENKNGNATLPDEYALYNIDLSDDNYIVSNIYITDPNIEIYGMSMKTDSNTIHKTFCDLGFEFLDKYSGLDSCYSKNGIEFRIYPSYISIG